MELSLAGCQPTEFFINFLFQLHEKIRSTHNRRLLLNLHQIVLSEPKELLEAQVSMFLEEYLLIKFANLKFLIYISRTDMLQFSLFRESGWIWEKMFTIS